MNRNFVVGLLGGVLGSATVLILLSAAGVVGARASQVQPDTARTHEVSAATPLSSTFTYQGKLQSGGKPINATCNFQFGLWDVASNGSQIGVTQTVSSLSVNDGYFTVLLNSGNEFGVSAFTGQMSWLSIAVKCGSETVYTFFTSRQALTPAPYALYATNGPFWSLIGNTGTNPNTNFLGTTDSVTLTLRVSNTVALRLASSIGTPNVIGGYEGNVISGAVEGGVIAGGGAWWGPNLVTANGGTVGGGGSNRAIGSEATVGGGWNNQATYRATVGGGDSNQAGSDWATVGGGNGNQATLDYATVGGGRYNQATGYQSTVGGGRDNQATGNDAIVGGGQSNQATGDRSTVGGGGGNHATGNLSTVGGGGGNQVTNQYATVGGGLSNQATADFDTIAGGYSNQVTGTYATVGGGYSNQVTATYGTIAGGYNITVTAYAATVGGGGTIGPPTRLPQLGAEEAIRQPAASLQYRAGNSTAHRANTVSRRGGAPRRITTAYLYGQILPTLTSPQLLRINSSSARMVASALIQTIPPAIRSRSAEVVSKSAPLAQPSPRYKPAQRYSPPPAFQASTSTRSPSPALSLRRPRSS